MKSALENGLTTEQKQLLMSFGQATLINDEYKHLIQLGVEPLDMLRYYIITIHGWKTKDVFELTEAQMYIVLAHEIYGMSL